MNTPAHGLHRGHYITAARTAPRFHLGDSTRRVAGSPACGRRARHADAAFRPSMRASTASSVGQRAVNATSIASALGMSRETVRRKLKQLLKLDFIVEKGHARYVLKPGVLQDPKRHAAFARAFQQTVQFMNECLEHGTVRWEVDKKVGSGASPIDRSKWAPSAGVRSRGRVGSSARRTNDATCACAGHAPDGQPAWRCLAAGCRRGFPGLHLRNPGPTPQGWATPAAAPGQELHPQTGADLELPRLRRRFSPRSEPAWARLSMRSGPNGEAWAHDAGVFASAPERGHDAHAGTTMRAQAPQCILDGRIHGITTVNSVELLTIEVGQHCRAPTEIAR